MLQAAGVREDAADGRGKQGGEDGVREGGVGGAGLERERHQVLRGNGGSDLAGMEDL